MQRTLALELSPPLSAVQRYFLSTPLFVLLAGALLLWQGDAALASRWSPAALAMTHLFTLGALGMSMAGALIQMLPVVAGCVIPGERTMTIAVHAMLGAGGLALAAAFMLSQPLLFRVALALLAPALLWLIGALAVALWQPRAAGAEAMTGSVRLALAALLVTVVLGAALGAAFAWPQREALLPLLAATDLHALWGVFGWGGLLLAGVSLQVVPMFQVTPLYAAPYAGRFGALVFLLLVLASVGATLDGPVALLAVAGLLACYAAFAVATLRLLARRTRPEPDAMTLFWRLAMGSLLALPLLWALPADIAGDGRVLALGVLAIVGFLFSTVNGMLYKIVPFLVWHQRQLSSPGQRGPSVKHIIPDRTAQRQFWLQLAALAMLLAACWWPQALARIAGAMLCLSAGTLAWNLARAVRAR